jgi:hypothetical protein
MGPLAIAQQPLSQSCNVAANTVPRFVPEVVTRTTAATTKKTACRRGTQLPEGNCDLLLKNLYIKAVRLNLQFFGIPLILECVTLCVE